MMDVRPSVKEVADRVSAAGVDLAERWNADRVWRMEVVEELQRVEQRYLDAADAAKGSMRLHYLLHARAVHETWTYFRRAAAPANLRDWLSVLEFAASLIGDHDEDERIERT